MICPILLPPVFIGDHVILENSTIGPFVSIGASSVIQNSIVSNAIIQTNCMITRPQVENVMFGNFVNFEGSSTDASLGDYSVVR